MYEVKCQKFLKNVKHAKKSTPIKPNNKSRDKIQKLPLLGDTHNCNCAKKRSLGRCGCDQIPLLALKYKHKIDHKIINQYINDD